MMKHPLKRPVLSGICLMGALLFFSLAPAGAVSAEELALEAQYLQAAGDIETPEIPVITTQKKGDVNGDGRVNANDLTALARHIARIELITRSSRLKNADVNGDQQVTADDLTHLGQYVARIIPNL